MSCSRSQNWASTFINAFIGDEISFFQMTTQRLQGIGHATAKHLNPAATTHDIKPYLKVTSQSDTAFYPIKTVFFTVICGKNYRSGPSRPG